MKMDSINAQQLLVEFFLGIATISPFITYMNTEIPLFKDSIPIEILSGYVPVEYSLIFGFPLCLIVGCSFYYNLNTVENNG